MSLTRALEILRKDLKLGPRSPLVLYAAIFPVVATLLVQVVFGSLFDPTPRLGIVDEGDSQITAAAARLGGIQVALLDSVVDLRRQVRANDLDAGLVLREGFDSELLAGKMPELELYVGGESLASNRYVIAISIIDTIRDLVGEPAPVDVQVRSVGGAESIPVSERLIPLLVLFAVLIAGLMVPAVGLLEEKEKGTLSALLVSPARMSDVLLAKGGMGFTLALAVGLVTLVLNGAFAVGQGALVVVLIIAALMCVELGLLVGSTAKDTNTLFGVVKGAGILLMAPVVFFIWPDLPQWAAKLFPTYYFLEPVYEIAVAGATLRDVRLELGVATLICAMLLPLVAWSGRRMARRLAMA